jgi:hypothetical protein
LRLLGGALLKSGSTVGGNLVDGLLHPVCGSGGETCGVGG